MSNTVESKTIKEMMDDIDGYFLPAIQREFVWAAEKIEALFDSMLRGYPVGTLLLWRVRKPAVHDFQFYQLIRDFDRRSPHNIKANLSNRDQCMGILDGQQRITSLYIGLLGSYAEKLPRLWRNNPDAFPQMKLYINLMYSPPEDDQEQKFQIRFLTERQVAGAKDDTCWYLVGDILKFEDRDQLIEFRRSSPHKDSRAFETNLDALWTAIRERDNVNYFLETRQDLDEVLRIFVRLNMGGTPLSHSDLLLSLATATWQIHDAREQVYNLVEYLNDKCGALFSFTKDFVLKALLVCSDHDVRFKTENIRRNNQLEEIWDRVKASLQLTVKLVGRFGFTGETLTATNAIIPITYYLFVSGANEAFLTQSAYAENRETIRLWLLKALLGKVFQFNTDVLLGTIRTTIRTAVHDDPMTLFPAEALDEMLRSTRGFRFAQDTIEGLVSDTTYGTAEAFPVLALLYSHFDYAYNQFHIDHIHPRSLFMKKTLKAEGMLEEEAEQTLRLADTLPNLQLLPGPVNEAKLAKPFAEWVDEQPDPAQYRIQSFIPDR